MLKKLIFLIFLQIFMSTLALSDSYITNYKRGRLGNNIISYYKAKLLEDKYNLSFVLTPFEFSDQFQFYLLEKSINSVNPEKYKPIHLKKNIEEYQKSLLHESTSNLMFYCHFTFKEENERYLNEIIYYFKQHPEFKRKLRRLIAPVNAMQIVSIPPNLTSAAIHVRKGGGFDRPLYAKQVYNSKASLTKKKFKHQYEYADVQYPGKFPSDQFYIDQIIWLSEKLKDSPMFVHIFTDDPDPERLLETYKRVVNKSNIQWHCRNEKNRYDINVLDDLFSMAKFDYLIRPDSTFSTIAQLIGDHKLVIYPLKSVWIEGRVLKVSKVGYYGESKNFR